MDTPIVVEQPMLPLGPGARCLRCDGAGDVYYLAGSVVVVGGKRMVCPECRGSGWVGEATREAAI
jgi:DnaJ-class molecular chaperone